MAKAPAPCSSAAMGSMHGNRRMAMETIFATFAC